MKHKKLPQRRKERRGNDEKINSQLRRVGKSIKPLRILCDLCASAVNNIVMMFHKWDTLENPFNPRHQRSIPKNLTSFINVA